MSELKREAEMPEEREARKRGEGEVDAVEQEGVPSPSFSLGAWYWALIACIVAGGITLAFRMNEQFDYDEVGIIDCGGDDIRVVHGDFGGISPHYVGFCDVYTYEDDFRVTGTIRIGFRVSYDDDAPLKMGDVSYAISAELSDYDSDILAMHEYLLGSGPGISQYSVLNQRVREALSRLSKGDCLGQEKCIEQELAKELRPELFRRWGIRLHEPRLTIYIP